ncbi:MAG TPA: DLW-39 family protein [Natronosporangium sp.]|nr:DLW-39 family protein [Natronosporangium sp.]
MWKKLLLLLTLVAGAALIARKLKSAADGRALWHEATTGPDASSS